MARLLAGENVVSAETRFLHRDGSSRVLIWNAAGSTDERIIYLAARDLTVIRLAGEELARSEENFRNSLDDSPLGVRIVTEGGETLYANGKILAIYGYDSLGELRSTPVAKRYTPESYALFQSRRDERRRGGDGPPEYAVDIVRKDGEIRHLRAFRKKVRWNGAEHYQAVSLDITEQKLAVDELSRADREKALLLKEIHHRVKNNMQIIISLLRLTARADGDEKLEEIFRESQNRIRAMAAVHSMLYQSGNFAGINAGAYIRQTADELFRAYNTSPDKIALLIDAEDVTLPLDAAVPCGLLINELISNALKHAFSKSGSGEIRVEMKKEENGVKIIFADNGAGFPEGIDFSDTKTLGLKLIQMLVAQLDGQIEMVQAGGTRYVITFKI
jgi:PAS domain S-box-containing protein